MIGLVRNEWKKVFLPVLLTTVLLAIAMGVFGAEGADAALLIALAYIVQVQAAAWYVKLTDRLFGAPCVATKAV